MRTHGVTGEAPRSFVARAVSEGDFHPASRPPRTTEYEVHASGARAPSQAHPHVPNASASAKPPEETARRTHARTLRSNARKQADRDMSRTRAHSDRDLHLQLQPARCTTHAADVAGAWPRWARLGSSCGHRIRSSTAISPQVGLTPSTPSSNFGPAVAHTLQTLVARAVRRGQRREMEDRPRSI